MKGSMQRRLTLALGLAVVITGLVAAAASFGFSYAEAQELQDDTLRQIAALVVPGPPGTRNTEYPLADPESRVVVLQLPRDPRPAWLPQNVAPGFHTFSDGGESSRVFVRAISPAGQIVVAQKTELRDEIALNSALRTLVPILVLLPLLAWLTGRIVASELAHIRRLATSVDGAAADRPPPLVATGVPSEIAPFLHAINRLLERVNRLMGEQRRFVADAAHELRSPLTALSIQVQNLEAADSLDAARARLIPLKSGIERAQRLVHQLLTLAKTQESSEAHTPIDLPRHVRDLIAEYLPLANARSIDLGMDAATAAHIVGSPDTLRLVLGNAIDNAVRYTPSGGEVTVRILAEGDDALVEVVDTGPGIPDADRARVFDAFHRIEGATGRGSGLGLAIASDAASRLGGVVSLHDRPHGTGLVFRYRQRRAPIAS